MCRSLALEPRVSLQKIQQKKSDLTKYERRMRERPERPTVYENGMTADLEFPVA